MEFGREELTEILLKTLSIPQTTSLIETQISKYKRLGYSYKEIAQALVYFTEVQGGHYVSRYGIGIVPTIMKEAKEYFYYLKKEKDRQIESVQNAKEQPNIILNAKKVLKRRKIEPIDIESLKD